MPMFLCWCYIWEVVWFGSLLTQSMCFFYRMHILFHGRTSNDNSDLFIDEFQWNVLTEVRRGGRKQRRSQFIWQSQVPERRWQGNKLAKTNKQKNAGIIQYSEGIKAFQQRTEEVKGPTEVLQLSSFPNICLKMKNSDPKSELYLF